jgi:hypothetical protein
LVLQNQLRQRSFSCDKTFSNITIDSLNEKESAIVSNVTGHRRVDMSGFVKSKLTPDQHSQAQQVVGWDERSVFARGQRDLNYRMNFI